MQKTKEITIIYASTSGNVELVADYVATILNDSGLKSRLIRAEVAPLDIFSTSEYFILATSTWGHGVLNPFFVNLYKQIKQIDLKGKKSAFIGLGDARYEEVYFNEGIEILKRAFLASGGEEFHRTLKLNGEPHKYLDILVKKWAIDLIEVFNNAK